MKNVPLLIAALLGTLVIVLGFSFMLSSRGATSGVADQSRVLGATTEHVLGQETAKVVVVEFSDLQCPACAAAHPLVKQILQKYGQDIRFVYRHLPLVTIHKNAQPAAQAAIAVGKLGKFWEFQDLLFAKQQEWSGLADPKEQFASYAENLGISKETFLQKLEETSDTARKQIADDVLDATSLGINATPTFYVNGKKTPVQDLLREVEKALGK